MGCIYIVACLLLEIKSLYSTHVQCFFLAGCDWIDFSYVMYILSESNTVTHFVRYGTCI